MDRAYEFETDHILPIYKLGGVVKRAISYFPGYSPAVRKGDWEVVATYKGIATYVEHVRTKAEAEYLTGKLQKTFPKFQVEQIDKKLVKEGEPRRMEVMKEMEDFYTKRYKDGRISKSEYDNMITLINQAVLSNTKLGGHHMYRQNIPGYEGRKFFKNDMDQVDDFIQALVDYPKEMATLIRNNVIESRTNAMLLDSSFERKFPNQMAIARDLINMGKGDFKTWTSGADTALRNFADDAVIAGARAMGIKDWFPKTHALDKLHGTTAHLFYMGALTSRPGFWLAQAMTSTQAMRLMFKTESTLEAFALSGKGMLNVISGGNTDFHKAVHWVATNTYTFHPQFRNEINSFGFNYLDKVGADKTAKFLRGVLPWVTGEKQAGIADSASRYVSFAMFYEKYKALGLSGEDLYLKAANDTDSAMVQYNAINKAPIIRKLGVAGDMIAPLQTFATAQLGNLVGDFQYWMKNPKDLRRTMPLMITGMTTALMAGAIGLPFIAEYEAIRMLAIAMGMNPDSIPSVIDSLSQEETIENKKMLGVPMPELVSDNLPKGTLTFGLPSAATGFDIGSGMRWNQVVSKVVLEGNDVMTIFPAVEYGRQLGMAIITAFKESSGTGMTREVEARKAAMMMASHVVGGKGLVDMAMFDSMDRDFVPGGTRGYAMREQSASEIGATFLGSGTLEGKLDNNVETTLRKQEEYRNQQRQKAIDVLLDASLQDDPEKAQKAIDKLIDLEVDVKSINRQINDAAARRNLTQRMRYYVSPKGKVTSKDNIRRYREMERFGSFRD
jgi:hypothetical protein